MYLFGLCVVVLGGLCFTSQFTKTVSGAISCPKCIDKSSGILSRVVYCTGCGDAYSAVFIYDCLACCHPTLGTTAGHTTVAAGGDCAITYIYESIWEGTAYGCSWHCTGRGENDSSCASDNLNSPNCTSGVFMGYQVGTLCDSGSSPACS